MIEQDLPVHCRVLLVEDHALVREGLRSLLSQYDDIQVVGEAASVGDAVAAVEETSPDVILLDLRLGGESGTDVARELRARGNAAKILVLSVHGTSRSLRDALAAGADGYLLKSVSGHQLAEGIRGVVAGDTVVGEEFVARLVEDAARGVDTHAGDLTEREQEILQLIASGSSNRELADQLGISVRTVHTHVQNLFKKFDVHDRAALVTQAFRSGLLG